MKKNIIVLSIVAVLGVSQVVGMKLTKSHSTSSSSLKNEKGSNVEIKFGPEDIKEIIVAAKNDALKKISDESHISLIPQANAVMKDLKDLLKFKKCLNDVTHKIERNLRLIQKKGGQERKTTHVEAPKVEKKQGFFSRLYNKVAENKGKVAAGVAGLGLLIGGAYYLYNNPGVITQAGQSIYNAFASKQGIIDSSTDVCRFGTLDDNWRFVNSGCSKFWVSSGKLNGLGQTKFKNVECIVNVVKENGKDVIQLIGDQCTKENGFYAKFHPRYWN